MRTRKHETLKGAGSVSKKILLPPHPCFKEIILQQAKAFLNFNCQQKDNINFLK